MEDGQTEDQRYHFLKRGQTEVEILLYRLRENFGQHQPLQILRGNFPKKILIPVWESPHCFTQLFRSISKRTRAALEATKL